MEAKLRRYKDILVVTGTGIIALAVWSTIQIVALLAFQEGSGAEIVEAARETDFAILIYVIIILAFMIPLSFHLFIGLSARSEGFGRKKRYVYIAGAFLMLIGYSAGMIYTIVVLVTGKASGTDNGIITILVDLTTVFVLIQMIIASIQVKRIAKKLAKEEAKCS